MATSGFQRFWVPSHSILPRALRQRAVHNIDMAVEPKEDSARLDAQANHHASWNPRAALPEQPWSVPNGHFSFTKIFF
jgi:hypothetical protein